MALDYTASIVSAANAKGVDPNLALAVAQAESSMNPGALSGAGAVGLFQLMPSSFPGANIYDPVTNIDLGVGYLATLLSKYNGDTTLALAAYNSGPGTVAKYGGVPPYPETQNYIAKILGMYTPSTTNTSATDVAASSDTGDYGGDGSGGLDPMVLGILGIGLIGLVAFTS